MLQKGTRAIVPCTIVFYRCFLLRTYLHTACQRAVLYKNIINNKFFFQFFDRQKMYLLKLKNIHHYQLKFTKISKPSSEPTFRFYRFYVSIININFVTTLYKIMWKLLILVPLKGSVIRKVIEAKLKSKFVFIISFIHLVLTIYYN